MTPVLRSVLAALLISVAACGGNAAEQEAAIADQTPVSSAQLPPVLTVAPSVTSAPVTPIPVTPIPVTPTLVETPASGLAVSENATAETRKINPDPAGVLPDGVATQIPGGYQLLGHATGDLNLDGRMDVAIIVRQPGDADFGSAPEYVPPRPVMLFVAEPDGGFALAARSDHAALCGRCGGTFGDPFADLVIDHGRISVGHYGGSAWRWTNTPTFAYDIVEDNWVLVGIGQSSFHASDPDNTFEDHSISDVDPVLFADYQSSW